MFTPYVQGFNLGFPADAIQKKHWFITVDLFSSNLFISLNLIKIGFFRLKIG